MQKPCKDKGENMRLRGHMTALSEGPTAQVNNLATKHPPSQEHRENNNSAPRKSKMQLRKQSNETGQPTMNRS